ncbi:MAG: FHA domain-containing protein [Bdellovibrionales bacterium]|nr:FHA domain-containing protein [Bdellovibrionales bacterium]
MTDSSQRPRKGATITEIVIPVRGDEATSTGTPLSDRRWVASNSRPIPLLRVTGGVDQGLAIAIKSSGIVTLGRDPGSQVALTAEDISRNHARLDWQEGGQLTLRDLGSSNGTWISSGDRLEKDEDDEDCVLPPGETFRLGAETFIAVNLVPHDEALAAEKASASRSEDPETGAITLKVFQESYARELSFLGRQTQAGMGFVAVALGTAAGSATEELRAEVQAILKTLRRDSIMGRLSSRSFGILVRDGDVMALQKICDRCMGAAPRARFVGVLVPSKRQDASLAKVAEFAALEMESLIRKNLASVVLEYRPNRP